MNYRVTCLTPTLVGDGQRLSPIDYMVWKDNVNVLDQRRIFKLLAKGPRLESYLGQLKRSEKLDFASWGGFAQNFAGRRIPFEHPSMTAQWERTRAEFLFIPTFASSSTGPFLPGSAIKGALRTAVIAGRWSHNTIEQVQSRLQTERVWRKVTAQAEAEALGAGGADRMRFFGVADSAAVPQSALKVFLVQVSKLVPKGNGFDVGWTPTPVFAEMAVEGTTFEGRWSESEFLQQPEIARALHWRQPGRAPFFEGANRFSTAVLDLHDHYAEAARLPALQRQVADLKSAIERARQSGGCVLPLGWGGGFHTKAGYLDTSDEAYRTLLRQLPFYGRAIRSGLPFPKTRRIVFLRDEPATLPGWVLLEAG